MKSRYAIKIVAFFLFFSVFRPAVGFAQSNVDINSGPKNSVTYTLAEIHRLALVQSERIKIAQETLYVAEQDRERAMAALYPSLSAFGAYTQYSENNEIQPNEAASIGVKLNQSFTLNGRELIALRIAKQFIKKSGYDLKTAQADYLFEITKAYFDVRKAQKAVEIAQADIIRKETHKKAVEVRLQMKTVAKTELFRTQAELSASKTELIRAENGLNLARTVLSRNLRLPIDFVLAETSSPISYKKDIAASVGDPSKLEILKPSAMEARSEMKALQLTSQVSEKQIDLARSAHWPRVGVEAGYTYTDGSPGSFFPEKDSLYASATLSFPIFEGGLRNAEIRQAMAAKRQAVLNESAMAKQITIEVEQALSALNNQQSLIESLEDQLKFSKATYDAVTSQFNYGVANSIDVMEADTLLVTTERQISEVRFDLELAEYRLMRAKGVFLSKIMESLNNAK